ncbi:germination protein [Collibacillus ludicampi]|uniref:Germination protein n=1 Tax=Collibacillus ludicampi TaxID=2771369 RepID=A0AAV4LJQ6_9BACL|nr:endospore germination permease [Collibacillus ludicampi]GIM47649.1 germination protein [Collibacillus ludicampi]
MIEKGKMSAFQMAIILYATVLATAILIVPSLTSRIAGRDLWLSPIWASLIGFFTVYVAIQLHKLYPGETIIQYCQHLLGSFPGKVIGFLYLISFVYFCGIILREYAEFIVGNFLTNTPMVVVIGSLIFVCAVAVRGGVEVIGRSAQTFSGLFIFPLLLMILMLLPDWKINNMFPVLEHGIMPSIMGAATPQAWFSEVFLMTFFLPFVTDRVKVRKYGYVTVFVILLTLVITNVTALFVFGKMTPMLVYPVMNAASYVNIADFLEHLEAVVMAVWVAGAFVKINAFYYALVLGTAQWLNLSDYRPLVLPYGILITLFSFWSLPNLQVVAHLLETIIPFNLPLFFTVIPSLLLFISLIRNKWRK